MKIIFYCQYVWGMGHLFRSVEFVRALCDHEVTLIAGGHEVDIQLPDHVTLLRLPTLYMDEKFTKLIPGNPAQNVDDIQHERKEILFRLFENQRPDLFIVELFPFGRTVFGIELKPLLEAIRQGRFGNVKSVCSLRDILVEKNHAQAYEERVLSYLNNYFDLLLIHSDDTLLPLDETFSRVDEIPVPIYYTGFVTQHGNPANAENLRQELGLEPHEKLIVASAGGGRAGYKPLKSVLKACHLLRKSLSFRVEVFSGPFMENEEFERLCALSEPGMNVHRFTSRFLDYLYAADLSVSLAGYNTCMNLLVTQVPALVIPYTREQEQPLRVERLKNFLPLRIIDARDLEPASLSSHIEQMLYSPPSLEPICLNLNGAQNAARYLVKWICDGNA
jgi:predicted glycosyltransferase